MNLNNDNAAQIVWELCGRVFAIGVHPTRADLLEKRLGYEGVTLKDVLEGRGHPYDMDYAGMKKMLDCYRQAFRSLAAFRSSNKGIQSMVDPLLPQIWIQVSRLCLSYKPAICWPYLPTVIPSSAEGQWLSLLLTLLNPERRLRIGIIRARRHKSAPLVYTSRVHYLIKRSANRALHHVTGAQLAVLPGTVDVVYRISGSEVKRTPKIKELRQRIAKRESCEASFKESRRRFRELIDRCI
jgi:hypothetical protein